MRKGLRRLVILMLIAAFSSLPFYGCGSRRVDANYAAYMETYKAFASREQKPLVDVQVDNNGKIKGFKMYERQQIPRIQQKQAGPGWRLVGGALRIAGIFGSIWAVGHSLDNIVESVSRSAGGNISIGDGNNWSAGKDINQALGGGVNVQGNTTYSSPDYSTPESNTGTDNSVNANTSTSTVIGGGIFEEPLSN